MTVAERVLFDALKRPLPRYAVAFLIFALAMALRLSIFPLDAGYPFFTFYPAVVLTAMLCGTGPTLMGIALSAIVCDLLLIPPSWAATLTYQAIASISVYAAFSIFINFIIQKSRQGSVERSLLAAIVRLADIAIISKTLKGIITSWNLEAERLFGYTASEAIGKPITILFPPDKTHEEEEIIAQVQRGESLTHFDTVRIRKDGSAVEVSVSLSPVLDLYGRITGVSKIVHDITRQRVYEEDLKLSNRNLIAAITELKRSNKELDEFAYIASHDLKEPLRGIHNYVSFLLEDYASLLDEESRNYLDRIQRLAERMTALTDCLLSLSRPGNTPIPMQTVDPNVVLNEVEEDVRPTLVSLGVKLRRAGRLPSVTGNSLRIREVFQNLIINAAKYNDKPQKWVEVGCEHTRAVPVYYVRDNGIGIPEQHRAAIFRIFKRLHEQNKFGGGTGAGLTITKKIIERHGGKIWLESTEGEGTTFYFTLMEGL